MVSAVDPIYQAQFSTQQQNYAVNILTLRPGGDEIVEHSGRNKATLRWQKEGWICMNELVARLECQRIGTSSNLHSQARDAGEKTRDGAAAASRYPAGSGSDWGNSAFGPRLFAFRVLVNSRGLHFTHSAGTR